MRICFAYLQHYQPLTFCKVCFYTTYVLTQKIFKPSPHNLRKHFTFLWPFEERRVLYQPTLPSNNHFTTFFPNLSGTVTSWVFCSLWRIHQGFPPLEKSSSIFRGKSYSYPQFHWMLWNFRLREFSSKFSNTVIIANKTVFLSIFNTNHLYPFSAENLIPTPFLVEDK